MIKKYIDVKKNGENGEIIPFLTKKSWMNIFTKREDEGIIIIKKNFKVFPRQIYALPGLLSLHIIW